MRNIKLRLFLCSRPLPFSSLSPCQPEALVPEGCRQAADLPLSLSLYLLYFFSPLLFSLHPSISTSRGAAFQSELMNLRWCMRSRSRIPSSGERRAVSKKKDDMWDRETWLDRSEPAWWGRRVGGRGRCEGAEELDMSFEKLK